MAKMSFARKKGILSDQSDAIKQHFYFSRMRKSHFLFAKLFRSFSLALFFFLCLSSILTVLLPTLSSFFCREFWLANFLGKGQI